MTTYHYNSGDRAEGAGELWTTLDVDVTSTFEVARTVFRVGAYLAPGDIVQVFGEAEFTNELPYVVSVCSGIRICSNWLDTTGILDITEFNGQNIDRSTVHHGVSVKVGAVTLPANWVPGNYCINWVSYAASDAANPVMINGVLTKPKIFIDQDYGRLHVLVHRN